MISRRKSLQWLTAVSAFAGLTALVAAPSANAQAFPTKPVRLVVPFPPGNASDVAARVLADKLRIAEEALRVESVSDPVLVEEGVGVPVGVALGGGEGGVALPL